MEKNETWREQYKKTGHRYIEPEEYRPCPGSLTCRAAIMQSDPPDPVPDDGPTWPKA